jgi:small subunit ribosomal protein S20
MANHSSTKKSIRKIERRTAINKNRLSRIKTLIKKANSAIEESTNEEALAAFRLAQSEISKGVSKGLFKKNTAARKISGLSSRLKGKSN